MSQRQHTLIDRLIGNLDDTIKSVEGPGTASRPNPSGDVEDTTLDATERKEAARLMRINHAGEVAAQALYQGQALTARNESVRTALKHAAAEEGDHLVWCEHRLGELGARPSALAPIWFAGSFAIGTLAGIAGDRWSLGFIAETERQVVEHIDGHLQRLPGSDQRSRAILEQMKTDETEHGDNAVAAGGAPLPTPIRELMKKTARVMTRTAYWI